MSADGPVVAGSTQRGSGGAAAEAARRGRGFCLGPPAAATSEACSGSLLSFSGTKWKLWDAVVGAVQVSHHDPAEMYTSACWGPATLSVRSGGTAEEGENTPSRRRSSRRGSGDVRVFIALGCASGRVQVWDPNTGEIMGPTANAFADLARGADCAVSALVASQPQRASVFAGCCALPEVVEIGVADGATRATFKLGKTGLGRLATSCCGDDWLLSAGSGSSSSLRLWALQELTPGSGTGAGGGAVRPHAHLASPANAVASLDVRGDVGEGRALALCTDGTMQVDVFTCSGTEKGSTTPSTPVGAVFALSCHEPVQVAQFATFAAKGEAESRTGVVGFGTTSVFFWSFRLGRASSDVAKTVPVSFSVSAEVLGGRVLSARPVARGGVSSASILVSSGHAAQPEFVVVRPPSAKGAKPTIEPLGGEAKASAIAEAADVAAPVPTTKRVAAEASVRTAAALKPTVLGPLEVASSRRRAPAPMSRETAGGGAAEAGEAPRKRAKIAELIQEKVTQGPIGLSIAPMVRQGLLSKDAASILQVLGNKDSRVIESTVGELTGVEAFDLLQEISKRLGSTGHSTVMCAWVQAILTRHCAFFGSQPALRRGLRPLQETLQARVVLHRSLVRLRGRLQGLKEMAKQKIEAQEEERETFRTPLLEYVEGDEDEEDSDGDAGAVDSEACDDEDSCSSIDPEDIFDDESDE